jgi:hypothetical protein
MKQAMVPGSSSSGGSGTFSLAVAMRSRQGAQALSGGQPSHITK